MQLKSQLPEHWFITITSDNAQIVSDWLIKEHNITKKEDLELYSTKSIIRQTISNNKPYRAFFKEKDAVELTTQEFKCLVLGEKLLVSSLKEYECIHVSTEEEDRKIRELLKIEGKCPFTNAFQREKQRAVYTYRKTYWDSISAEEAHWTIYPANYFITTNQSTMEKEIIGWKLKEECRHLELGICKILHSNLEFLHSYNNSTNFTKDSIHAQILEKAGVFQLWFNEVYTPEKPKEEVVEMAEGFTLIIKDKKVFHKDEDITSYVKGLCSWIKEKLPKTFGNGNWAMEVETIIFKKTGCQNKLSSSKDWLSIYEKIK